MYTTKARDDLSMQATRYIQLRGTDHVWLPYLLLMHVNLVKVICGSQVIFCVLRKSDVGATSHMDIRCS